MNTCSPNRRGRFLLAAVALGLIFSGLFALALAWTGRFLPHDERFLGMAAGDLCALHGCRIVHFMIHDRASFGGALIALGLLYLWLIEFPLRRGQPWAWWLLLLSGTAGFASFFAYLGYGYFDAWHAAGTLALLGCFVTGLARSWPDLARPRTIGALLQPSVPVPWLSSRGLGRAGLLAVAVGMTGGGLVILLVGMTCVFVPQDLGYLGLPVEELHALNPRLVPLIAHDRAGFGGAVGCTGITLFFCVWCGKPSRALWWVLCLAGVAGFAPAIGVHPAIGYNDAVHLAPAGFGALAYLAGLIFVFRPMRQTESPAADRGWANAPPVLASAIEVPLLRQLGNDLQEVTVAECGRALAAPFLCCGAYFALAGLGWWVPAILALAALQFITYGSTSHDLVHRSLGLPKRLNDVLLCAIELLALRSGHAYQAAHLHHHARFPQTDDVEGAAAHMSLTRAFVEGVVFPYRIWWWAVRHATSNRGWLYGEAAAVVTLLGLAVRSFPESAVFIVYAGLMIAGAWLNPLITAYLPHDPAGPGPLFQTRRFRGTVASVIALKHLYHLEHHLYPSVPHQRWPELAKRLDPYLETAGVRTIRFWV